MPKALILGGTGQIGLAVAKRLRDAHWDVTLASRTRASAQEFAHLTFERNDANSLSQAVQNGADLLVDCIGFTAKDARALLNAQNQFGHITAISSASVYTDAQGRTLDTAKAKGFPEYPVPIPENHASVAPGPDTYSSNKAAMEQVLRSAQTPVTILRPCAIHGVQSKHAREWWFVKRLREGRSTIPLARMGQSQFQTTSCHAIAEIVLKTASTMQSQTLNVTDADAPSVLEIGTAIMAHLKLEAELVPIETEHPTLGLTPWSLPNPIICEASYPSTKTYAQSVAPALDWLATLPLTGWEPHLPQLAAYPRDHFDYETEDASRA